MSLASLDPVPARRRGPRARGGCLAAPAASRSSPPRRPTVAVDRRGRRRRRRAARRRVRLRRPGRVRPDHRAPRPTSCAPRSRDTGYPFYVAVLPALGAVDGSSSATLAALAKAVGQQGCYALYIGDSTGTAFRAGDTDTKVSALATVAYRDNKDAGAYAVISAFVTAATPVVTGQTATRAPARQ